MMLGIATGALAIEKSMYMMEGASELIPMRVWVFPTTEGSVYVEGHYEHFTILLHRSDIVAAIEAPTYRPALPAIPMIPKSKD